MIYRLLLAGLLLTTFLPGQPRRRAAAAALAEKKDQRTLTVEGVERSYTVVQPASRGPAIPIVLVFHSANANSETMVRLAALNQRPGTRQELIVYPDGLSGTWSGRAHDVIFVNALIDELLKNDTALDRTRVYAVGAGAGGFFVQRLGCELNAKIAAVAAIGATMPAALQKSCKAQDAVPIMLINAITAGSNSAVMSMADTFAFWRKQNGCSGEPVTETRVTFREVEIRALRKCRDASEVVIADIKGGLRAQTWPAGASGEILEFLTRFRRTPRF